MLANFGLVYYGINTLTKSSMRFKKSLIFLIASFAVWSCEYAIENTFSVPTVKELNFANHTFSSSNYISEIDDLGHHKNKYIGHKNEPIILENVIDSSNLNLKYKEPSLTDLKVIVNTNQIVSEVNSNTGNDYQAYPIIIENISHDTLAIGTGGAFALLLLVKFDNQNWKVLTKSNYYQGLDPVILKPKELAVTFGGITNGMYKATFKYVLIRGDSNFESNIFSGRLNGKLKVASEY